MGTLAGLAAASLFAAGSIAAALLPVGISPLAVGAARAALGGAALLLFLGPPRTFAAVRAVSPLRLPAAAAGIALYQSATRRNCAPVREHPRPRTHHLTIT